MKKITLLTVLLIGMLVTNAQNLTLTFNAKGLSTVLNLVQVKNLTKGITKPIMGSDKINLKGTSGINDLGSNEGSVLIKPNPMSDKTELSFYAEQSGMVEMDVFDISGKNVLQLSNNLKQGTHTYEISGLKQGIYMLKISGKDYQYSSRLISSNNSMDQPDLKYAGFISVQNILKTSMIVVEMDFSWGDSLRFIGSNSTYTDTIFDVPTGSKTITFIFGKPALITTAASNITNSSASSGGNITSDAGIPITSRGVCWSISSNPKITDNKTTNGSGSGTFSSLITGLTSNTKYYVRAYAINEGGTFYGNEVSFTTVLELPELTTTAITSVTQTTAESGGYISTEGGGTVTARGVCWSTSPSPTISNSKTSNGTGGGTFTSSLTGLTSNTHYYLRAYATNSYGTAYGKEDTFTTRPYIVPVLTTTSITSIMLTTASGGGNISYDGGSAVTARGICWSTNPNPTISDTKTSDGSGTGSFTSALTGLTDNTTYYVRAYATNTTGTGYGNEVSFQTLPYAPGDLRVRAYIQPGTYYGWVDVYVYKSAADRSNDVTRKNYFKYTWTSTSDPYGIGAFFTGLLPAQYYIYCVYGGTKTGTGDIFVMPNTTTIIEIGLH